MIKIEQHHRDAAADKLDARYPNEEKTKAVTTRIRNGDADDHPSVQAEAFYQPI